MKVTGVENINQMDRISDRSLTIVRNSGEKQIKDKVNMQQNNLQMDSKKLKEEVRDKVEEMNNIVDLLDRDIAFKLHDKTKQLMVQIIDVKTQEVIKEMPPEELLDLIARIEEMVGLIIDEKV